MIDLDSFSHAAAVVVESRQRLGHLSVNKECLMWDLFSWIIVYSASTVIALVKRESEDKR